MASRIHSIGGFRIKRRERYEHQEISGALFLRPGGPMQTNIMTARGRYRALPVPPVGGALNARSCGCWRRMSVISISKWIPSIEGGYKILSHFLLSFSTGLSHNRSLSVALMNRYTDFWGEVGKRSLYATAVDYAR